MTFKRTRSESPEIPEIAAQWKRVKALAKVPFMETCRLTRAEYTVPIPDVFVKMGLVTSPIGYIICDRKDLLEDQRCLLEYPHNTRKIESLIKRTCRHFMESVVTVGRCHFLVTSVDAFIRNDDNLDDAALQDLSSPYPEEALAKIVRKSGGKHVFFWDELVIYIGRIELLITGSLMVLSGGTEVSAFLGSSVKCPPSKFLLLHNTVPAIYCKVSSPIVVFRERLLRNYNRHAAKKHWGADSALFSLKGFSPPHPLYVVSCAEDGDVGLACHILRLVAAQFAY